MPTRGNLSRALQRLAVDPVARAEFDANPDSAAKLLGLQGDAKTALINRDADGLQKLILRDYGQDRAQVDAALAAAGDIEVVLVIVI